MCKSKPTSRYGLLRVRPQHELQDVISEHCGPHDLFLTHIAFHRVMLNPNPLQWRSQIPFIPLRIHRRDGQRLRLRCVSILPSLPCSFIGAFRLERHAAGAESQCGRLLTFRTSFVTPNLF